MDQSIPKLPDTSTLASTKIASVELYYCNDTNRAWTIDGDYLGPWYAVVNKYTLETYGGTGRVVPHSWDFNLEHNLINDIFQENLSKEQACDRISFVIKTMREFNFALSPIDTTQRYINPSHENWKDVYQKFTSQHNLNWSGLFKKYKPT